MEARKWVVILGWCVSVGCGVKPPHKRVLKAEHIGGEPFAEKWILPVKTATPSQGWWNGESYEILGDTLFTDESGMCPLPPSVSIFDAILCQPLRDSHPPFLTNSFEQAFSDEMEVWSIELPQVVWLNLVGNRTGQFLGSRIWVGTYWENPSLFDDEWFTPGHPPRPNYLMTHWVMPDATEPFNVPIQFLDDHGQNANAVTIEFRPVDLLDTLTVPLNL